jgi:hypothetical protein
VGVKEGRSEGAKEGGCRGRSVLLESGRSDFSLRIGGRSADQVA